MRMTDEALVARAIRRGHLAAAVIAVRAAEQHLNAGNHEDLIIEAIDEAVAALARATGEAS
jgi:hypothetical protein